MSSLVLILEGNKLQRRKPFTSIYGLEERLFLFALIAFEAFELGHDSEMENIQHSQCISSLLTITLPSGRKATAVLLMEAIFDLASLVHHLHNYCSWYR